MTTRDKSLRSLLVLETLAAACTLSLFGCADETAVVTAWDAAGAEADPTDAGIDPGTPFSFFVVSDPQGNSDGLRDMVEEMLAVDPEAVACLCLGDLTQSATSDEWEAHNRALALGSPVHASEADPFVVADGRFRTDVGAVGDHVWYMAAVGNHDILSADWHDRWVEFLSGQSVLGHNHAETGCYFSVMMGNTLLILLDSTEPSHAQTAWLEEVLASDVAANAVFKLAFFHYPVYPCNYKTPFDAGIEWVELFELYGVDAVFHGHAHTYERTCPMIGGECVDGGVVYITTSGAPKNTRIVLPEKKDKAAFGDREDEYACSSILDRYRSYWSHWSRVEVDGCTLTFLAYPHRTPPGKGVPWDTLTIDKCD